MTTAKDVINSTKQIITKAPRGQTQKGSAGYDNVREDIEKIKKIREGSVEKTPTADTDIANKKYVDDTAGGGGTDWTVSQAPSVVHADNYTDTNTQLAEADITTMGFTKDVEVDWTVSQAPAVVHAANYTDTDTTYVSSDFTHDDLTGFVADEHLDWKTDRGANNIHVNNITAVPEAAVTAHVAAIDHDSCLNFLADEHLDWTTDRGATNIHAGNYTDTNTQLSQENVEDYAGALIANASGTHTGISVTYQDATGDMDLVIDHDTASNFVANEHIDHTGVTLTAGTNMTGGGTIAANRTFNVALTTGTNVTGDHGTAATDQVVNVCYGTGDPPAANTMTEGALWVKYTA